MIVKLTILAILACCVVFILKNYMVPRMSDFKQWASDPVARKRIEKQMKANQNRFLDRRQRLDARIREIHDMDEDSFDAFIRGLDFEDLAKDENNEYENETERDKTKDRLHGAITRLICTGDLRHWEAFSKIIRPEIVYGVEHIVLAAIQSMQKRNAEFNEFHHWLCARIMEKLNGDARLESEEIEICLIIDKERTLATLNAMDSFDVGSSKYNCILDGCLEQNVSLDIGHLRKMLALGKQKLTENRSGSNDTLRDDTGGSVAGIVKMMGMLKSDGVEQEARDLLDNFQFYTYDAIRLAEAITLQYGIESMDELMEAKYEKEIQIDFPFEKVDKFYKAWVSIGALDDQVRNGGFVQYFANDFGYQFLAAIEAFEEIGEHEIYELLTPIRNAFDANPPKDDYSAEKLQNVFDSIEPLLDKSDGPYYRTSNHACANLNLYLLDQINHGTLDMLD